LEQQRHPPRTHRRTWYPPAGGRIQQYGKPDQVLTDQGTQFHRARGDPSAFTEFCAGKPNIPSWGIPLLECFVRACGRGNVGAGMGATVEKMKGMKFACKGGCGTSAITLLDKITVGAVVVTNALGNIYDVGSGKTIAGVKGDRARFLEFEEIIPDHPQARMPHSNTTIGVVATNAGLSHERLIKVAQMAHDGLAMAIRPVHMSMDGDTIFAASTARIPRTPGREGIVDTIGYTAVRCVANAVVRNVKAARTLEDLPAASRQGIGRFCRANVYLEDRTHPSRQGQAKHSDTTCADSRPHSGQLQPRSSGVPMSCRYSSHTCTSARTCSPEGALLGWGPPLTVP